VSRWANLRCPNSANDPSTEGPQAGSRTASPDPRRKDRSSDPGPSETVWTYCLLLSPIRGRQIRTAGDGPPKTQNASVLTPKGLRVIPWCNCIFPPMFPVPLPESSLLTRCISRRSPPEPCFVTKSLRPQHTTPTRPPHHRRSSPNERIATVH